MVTLLIADGIAFGVRVRRASRSPKGGNLARNEVRCWIASAHSKKAKYEQASPEQKIGHDTDTDTGTGA